MPGGATSNLRWTVDAVSWEDEQLDERAVSEPEYHFWGRGKDTGPKGYDGVRRYYEEYVKSGGAILSSPKERIIVDDNSAHHLLHMRSTILWSFDENGLAYGEDAYTTIDPDGFEKVERSELPQVYVDYLTSIGHEV